MTPKQKLLEGTNPHSIAIAVDEYIDDIIKELRSARQALADTKAQLEALEDAVMYYMTSGGYIMELNEERKKILHQAIANSRARKQG